MKNFDLILLIGGIFIIAVSLIGVHQVIIDDDSYYQNQSDENKYNGTIDSQKVTSELYTLTNKNRGDRGINTLDRNMTLENVAEYKANKMKEQNYFNHTSPDGSTFNDRLNKFGVNCQVRAENLAQTYYMQEIDPNYQSNSDIYKTEKELAKGIDKQFMASESHKQSIINSQYTDYGIGFSITDKGKVYAVQIFCS